ncbi:MAG: polysaccharide deacetylase family protein [Chitinophagaceae bacterium]|nr:polysaccharide deacetylase family protein [Chitinophagaceae bacterium]MCW5904236.1 polysaccharide deacetylase family protein [Chitinophagaceae bacterium]
MPKNNKYVTIIMYHYIRDLLHSKYPTIKGLDIALFYEQIEYLKKHYQFITMETLIDSIQNNTSLPNKSVLLTFDDAYSEHFKYVFPFLDKHKIQGSFYPPVKAISEHTVLDVNKIHFILASENNKLKIISEIKNELNKYKKDYELKSFTFYFKKLAKSTRYDSAEVMFIKRLLQVELEEKLRNTITQNLFEKIVGIDEESFSRDLYMDVEQIKCMNRHGMHIGGHGYNHYWLGSLEKEEQKIEIEKSLNFLSIVGSDIKNWTMCYPYGSYNNTMLELLTEYNCKLALTTVVGVANIQKHHKFTLPRLDTNDVPKKKNADTNNWYLKG